MANNRSGMNSPVRPVRAVFVAWVGLLFGAVAHMPAVASTLAAACSGAGSARILPGMFFLPSGVLMSAGRAEVREPICLDGVWDFATDPENRGEAEQWYRPGAKLPDMPRPGYAAAANGKIRVPGIWDVQGYGTETEKLRHQFIGKGWYRRQVEIPQSWAGRRVFLSVTGVSRYAKVWLDGRLLGEHIGCLSSAEYDVTGCVAAGRTATIAIQVDSKQRWEIDSMRRRLSLADYMDVPWGGIWGHVARSTVRRLAQRHHVQPSLSDSSCTVSAVVNGNANLADGVNLAVVDAEGRCVAAATVRLGAKIAAGQPVRVTARLKAAELWTPDTPTLYKARLSLLHGQAVVDAVESRFGMRRIHGRRSAAAAQRQADHAARLRRRPHLSPADGHAVGQGVAPPAAESDQVLQVQPRPPPQHDPAAGVL